MENFQSCEANCISSTHEKLDHAIKRRDILSGVVGAASFCLLQNKYAMGQSAPAAAPETATALRERFDTLLLATVSDDGKLAALRGERERYIAKLPTGLDVLSSTLENRLPPSSTQISQRATDLIVEFEVSSPDLYAKKYQGPTWPGGDSGVTIGIGYDIGYISKTFFKDDWQGLLPDDVIETLSNACGKKGESAKSAIDSLRAIKIDWVTAQTQFLKRDLPLYIADTEAALKNTNLLPPDSMGAIVSLVYNRGASFSNTDGNHAEMRNIKTHMTNKEFSKIPDEFRAMKYLWDPDHKDLPGLITRRELEALLFEHGLATA